MKKLFVHIQPFLAWMWIGCLVGTTADAVTPLEFTNRAVVSGLHCGLGLLLYPAAWHFRASAFWPRLLYRGVLLVLLLATITLGWYAMPLYWSINDFFFATDANPTTWHTSHVYLQRGQRLVVLQNSSSWGGSSRYVELTPVTPLFRLVWRVHSVIKFPSKNILPGYEDWTRVDKDAADFSLDPAKQRRLDVNLLAKQQCLAAKQLEDSLARRGQVPKLTLPASTQQGASIFGFLLENELWRNHSLCFREQVCADCGVDAWDTALPHQHSHSLHLLAVMNSGDSKRTMRLHLMKVTGPGLYPFGQSEQSPGAYLGLDEERRPRKPPVRSITGIASKHAAAEPEKISRSYQTYVGYPSPERPLPTVGVRITRFDTVAHIVAGTFEGYVNDGLHDKPLSIQQGRFDVKYHYLLTRLRVVNSSELASRSFLERLL